jgi:imidazolonepropionase-like amidohydrolase
VLALVALALSAGLAAQEPNAEALLVDVTVLDGGAPLPHRDILISDGVIDRIAPTGELGRYASKILDLPGRFVVPGFVDLHAHVLLHPWQLDGQIAPRFDREATLRSLRLLLAHGVTTLRDPGSETEAALTFRRLAAENRILAPRILTAGRILNASDFSPEPFQPVTSEAEIRREIAFQAAAGVDAIKVYASTPPEWVKVAIDEAHARKLPVLGHLQRTTWTEAARLGIDGIEHAAPWGPGSLFDRVAWLENVDLDAPTVKGMVGELAARNVVVDPTVIAMHSKLFGDDPRYRQDPDQALLPASVTRGWPAGSFTASWTPAQYAAAHAAWPKLKAWVKHLHDGGVRLGVGTDTPTPWIVPGASLHRELELLVECGLSAGEVLRMATAENARALKLEKEIGGVREGMKADLVVLRDDPSRDIRNTRTIEWVLHDGVARRPAEILAAP